MHSNGNNVKIPQKKLIFFVSSCLCGENMQNKLRFKAIALGSELKAISACMPIAFSTFANDNQHALHQRRQRNGEKYAQNSPDTAKK